MDGCMSSNANYIDFCPQNEKKIASTSGNEVCGTLPPAQGDSLRPRYSFIHKHLLNSCCMLGHGYLIKVYCTHNCHLQGGSCFPLLLTQSSTGWPCSESLWDKLSNGSTSKQALVEKDETKQKTLQGRKDNFLSTLLSSWLRSL